MLTTVDSLWNKITSEVKSDPNNRASSKIFLSGITPSGLEGDQLVLEAVNEFCREWVEKRYSQMLQKILCDENPALNYKLVTRANDRGAMSANKKHFQPELPVIEEECAEKTVIKSGTPKVVAKTVANPKIDGMFNNKYTFDSFVVGKSNQFAYAICQSVTKNLGNLHNPVFIYGGVGLGKTHLMQAIGQVVHENNPKARVAYVSSEAFTNEFIDSLKDKKAEAFRNKYRRTDVLLIDDVQFFAGKEQTQEEFFHTFNALFQQKKQIVLSSDSPPDKIKKLEERLASRYAMGVVVDIQPPDLEMRAAILKKCATKSMVEVPDDVIMYLAQGVTSNIRILEGAFNSVLAYSGIVGKPISKDLVDQVLKDMLRESSDGKITIPWIKKRVSEFYDISEEEIIGKRRSQNLVLPRQIAMRLCQIFTDSSLKQIGEKFGNRDHTTVMHACSKINKLLKQEKAFVDEFSRLKRFVDPSKQ